ncbi:hypothetical protein [Mariprofundus ferrooxydans]|uniref:Uncharacterized protein n=1 Tax=Mariprofundus ferrooxydans PV-1 TaxID=314345 RepID=Q0EWC6_9PROT|nr:hypothetical protein [Mariprofundus ferrooxydans]EAU53545.1 hypothetical protein SPV1_02868 [Mariprofundus ferrooxydans PV-1]KON47006.1 hypothetical protein AL013_10465 [Mariprofundus ferrooxydans]
MIQTMLDIWWLLFVTAIGSAGWFGWEAWKAGNTTEGFEAFGDAVLAAICIIIALLAGATICALRLAVSL